MTADNRSGRYAGMPAPLDGVDRADTQPTLPCLAQSADIPAYYTDHRYVDSGAFRPNSLHVGWISMLTSVSFQYAGMSAALEARQVGVGWVSIRRYAGMPVWRHTMRTQ
jgi:hypothetical protein